MSNNQSSSNSRLRGASSPLIILVVLLVVLGGYIIYKVQLLEARVKVIETAIGGQSIEISQIKALFKKGNMVFGNSKSKALVVEFSDPSCPYCHVAAYGANWIEEFQGKFKTVAEGGQYAPPVQGFRKLAKEGKIGYVSLYANGHGAGEIAAQALYCSYEQDKYWEAHDLLFSATGYNVINTDVKNDKANIPTLVEFLSTAVDTAKLQSCLESGKYAKKLSEDMQIAQSLNFSGTPMFLINIKKFAGAYSFTDMEADLKPLL